MLAVDGTRFHAVQSELVLLRLIAQELRFLDVARSLAAEVTHRVVELIKASDSFTQDSCPHIRKTGPTHHVWSMSRDGCPECWTCDINVNRGRLRITLILQNIHQPAVQRCNHVSAVPRTAETRNYNVISLAYCLQVFNSRMCQLVLGAGAMQVAGLKSITAKHLALSCQCLGALIALQPPLATLLVSHLPPSRHALVNPELDLVLKVTVTRYLA